MQGGWNGWSGKRRLRCGGCNGCCSLVGVVLLAAGLLVLFLCIPDWAWLALLGVALIAAGCLLIKRAMTGR